MNFISTQYTTKNLLSPFIVLHGSVLRKASVKTKPEFFWDTTQHAGELIVYFKYIYFSYVFVFIYFKYQLVLINLIILFIFSARGNFFLETNKSSPFGLHFNN